MESSGNTVNEEQSNLKWGKPWDDLYSSVSTFYQGVRSIRSQKHWLKANAISDLGMNLSGVKITKQFCSSKGIYRNAWNQRAYSIYDGNPLVKILLESILWFFAVYSSKSVFKVLKRDSIMNHKNAPTWVGNTFGMFWIWNDTNIWIKLDQSWRRGKLLRQWL